MLVLAMEFSRGAQKRRPVSRRFKNGRVVDLVDIAKLGAESSQKTEQRLPDATNPLSPRTSLLGNRGSEESNS